MENRAVGSRAMRKPPSNHSVVIILPQLAADETVFLCYNQKWKRRMKRMWQETAYPEDKKELYDQLTLMLRGLMAGERDMIANLANTSALLADALERINWAGFYLMKDGMLVLGPFQGKPACTVIEKGKGVCGTAIAEDRTQLVKNVHEFPGHIACDSASNSEIVIPIHAGGVPYGVLDIDSPQLGRFSEKDKEGLEAFVRILESAAAIK
jgi:GAF domain-containing protein